MKTILIVEDNEADQYIFSRMMKKAMPDAEIWMASDGEEALEILNTKNHDPDLILLDINMPRMNGHEFLKKFTDDNKREIPVVVMLTSSEQEKDKNKTKAYRCVHDYIVKPLTKASLQSLEPLFVKKVA